MYLNFYLQRHWRIERYYEVRSRCLAYFDVWYHMTPRNGPRRRRWYKSRRLISSTGREQPLVESIMLQPQRCSRLSLLVLALLTFLSCASFAVASGKSCPLDHPSQVLCDSGIDEVPAPLRLNHCKAHSLIDLFWFLLTAPASFCKCTCFSNSTIIPLDSAKRESTSFSNEIHYARDVADSMMDKRANSYQALSCNDCNRKFCLGYDLPVCKGAKEDDVTSTCFRMPFISFLSPRPLFGSI